MTSDGGMVPGFDEGEIATFETVFASLDALAPSGAAVAVHIRSASPWRTQSGYNKAWKADYESGAYALRDPVIWWGLSHTGSCRWSEIGLPDPYGILSKAAAAGLTYGSVFSCGPLLSRSVAAVARSDREFNADELAIGLRLTERLHQVTRPAHDLTDAQKEALCSIADGKRLAQAAHEIGVSESALKARLLRVREVLDVRTLPEAIRKANHFGMI